MRMGRHRPEAHQHLVTHNMGRSILTELVCTGNAPCVTRSSTRADEVKVTQNLPGIEGWAYAIALHPSAGSVVVSGSDGQLRRVGREKPAPNERQSLPRPAERA